MAMSHPQLRVWDGGITRIVYTALSSATLGQNAGQANGL